MKTKIKIESIKKPSGSHPEAKGRRIYSNTAMTLVEMVITLAILGMVLYPIYDFLKQGALSWQTGENKTEVVQNARIGLDKMCDEIKHSRLFYTINAAQVRFWWKDLDSDSIADTNEIITYAWSGTPGTDLTRKLDSEAQSSALANYVDSFALTYYNEAGVQASTPADVYFITAQIRIKKTEQGKDYISTMRKGIHPRNI